MFETKHLFHVTHRFDKLDARQVQVIVPIGSQQLLIVDRLGTYQGVTHQLRKYQGTDRTAQHSTAQHSTAQHSTAQHSTAQHSTAQHSTAQHSTGQHKTKISQRMVLIDFMGWPNLSERH
jgi:hypothetical protein